MHFSQKQYVLNPAQQYTPFTRTSAKPMDQNYDSNPNSPLKIQYSQNADKILALSFCSDLYENLLIKCLSQLKADAQFAASSFSLFPEVWLLAGRIR